MKFLFCGGGTGGHISPAIAIAEYAESSCKNTSVAFVGRKNGEENLAIKRKKYKLYEIEISGLERRISLQNLKNIFKTLNAIKESKKIIKDFRPDAVIGTGGYVTFPVIKAAQKLKIPTFIHESNAAPGLVTRLVAGKCNKIFLNREEAKDKLKNKSNIKVVGNPLRASFRKTNREEARRKLGINPNEFFIVSFGGSGGAKKINDTVTELMEKWHQNEDKTVWIHACGRKYYNNPSMTKASIEQSEKMKLVPYIDNMADMLSAADAVISRSGAISLTELAACSSAAILIPSPNVTDNHQYKNAKALSEKGAAILIEENTLNTFTLSEALNELKKNKNKRESMQYKIHKEYIKNSSQLIIDEIMNVTNSALF